MVWCLDKSGVSRTLRCLSIPERRALVWLSNKSRIPESIASSNFCQGCIHIHTSKRGRSEDHTRLKVFQAPGIATIALAMATFGFWSWPGTTSESAAAVLPTAEHRHERSRSPRSALSSPGGVGVFPAGAELPPSAVGVVEPAVHTPAWSTGVAACDAWLQDNIDDPQVLTNFAELPVRNRKSIVLKTMDAPKENPVAWIAACINNHRMREMEKRLTSTASPHQTPMRGATSPYTSAAALSQSSDASVSPAGVVVPTHRAVSNRGEVPADTRSVVSWNQDPAVLAWSAETWTQCAKNTSALIRALRSTVTPETWGHFAKLPLPIQAAMATTWVFANPGKGPRADEFLQAWVSRFNSVGSRQPSAAASDDASRSQSVSLRLQFIIIGVTAAYQYVLVEAAAKMATLGRRVSFTLLPVLSCEVDEMTAKVLPQLSSAGSTLKIAPCSTAQELAQNVGREVNSWQRDGVKVLVLTTLPGGPTHARVFSQKERALHASATRHFWFAQGLTGRLMAVLGQSNVVDVHVGPEILNADARSEMETLVGATVPHEESQETLPATERCFVMSNVKVAVAPVQQFRGSNAAGPIDEWVCEAVSETNKPAGPISVFATLPALLCVRLFEERALGPDEQTLLADMTMKHRSAGEIRSVGRQFHHRWLGLEGTPLAGALQKIYPCMPWIVEATGEASECRQVGSACGCKRFCLNCEQVFEMTTSLPSLAAALPPFAAVFDVALKEWSQSISVSWCNRELSRSPHHCDASCPKNPEKGC